MITPDQAWDWNVFKSRGGPTYAGSAGWKRYTDFLISKMQEFGAVDFDYVESPYDHYIVDDWPDRRTHLHVSRVALEKLVSDGAPVPVVASYGMTSGFTPPEGVTAQMLYYDPAKPPSAEAMAGKILVFQTASYPDPPYANSFLDNYALTDYEWRSPGKWAPLFTPPAASVTSSYHCRWVWSQLNGFAAIGIRGHAAGIVVVYDLSPGAAFGLAQRSVYTPDGKAGLGANRIFLATSNYLHTNLYSGVTLKDGYTMPPEDPWLNPKLGFIGVWNIRDRGDVPPLAIFKGPYSQVLHPTGLALNPKDGEIYVTDSIRNALFTYLAPDFFR